MATSPMVGSRGESLLPCCASLHPIRVATEGGSAVSAADERATVRKGVCPRFPRFPPFPRSLLLFLVCERRIVGAHAPRWVCWQFKSSAHSRVRRGEEAKQLPSSNLFFSPKPDASTNVVSSAKLKNHRRVGSYFLNVT